MTDLEDPEFGESNTTTGPRGEISVFVRRSLNKCSGLDEVFSFEWIEPSRDQAERDGYPTVRYSLVQESRNSIPGFDDAIFGRMIPLGEVPDEVRERAQKTVDQLQIVTND